MKRTIVAVALCITSSSSIAAIEGFRFSGTTEFFNFFSPSFTRYIDFGLDLMGDESFSIDFRYAPSTSFTHLPGFVPEEFRADNREYYAIEDIPTVLLSFGGQALQIDSSFDVESDISSIAGPFDPVITITNDALVEYNPMSQFPALVADGIYDIWGYSGLLKSEGNTTLGADILFDSFGIAFFFQANTIDSAAYFSPEQHLDNLASANFILWQYRQTDVGTVVDGGVVGAGEPSVIGEVPLPPAGWLFLFAFGTLLGRSRAIALRA